MTPPTSDVPNSLRWLTAASIAMTSATLGFLAAGAIGPALIVAWLGLNVILVRLLAGRAHRRSISRSFTEQDTP